MNDQDYIRKAIELADGWKWIGSYDDGIDYARRAAEIEFERLDTDNQFVRDALAAQLVRQVDALNNIWFDSDMYGTAKLWGSNKERKSRIAKSNNDDRTMNTIKAIVDNGVLEA